MGCQSFSDIPLHWPLRTNLSEPTSPPSPDLDREMKLQIVIPIYNDWESLLLLLPLLGESLQRAKLEAELLLVDDGSSQSPPAAWGDIAQSIRCIRILKARRNLGANGEDRSDG